MADARRVERELLVLAWFGSGLRLALGLELRVPAVLRGADVPNPNPNPNPNSNPNPNPNPNQADAEWRGAAAGAAEGDDEEKLMGPGERGGLEEDSACVGSSPGSRRWW